MWLTTIMAKFANTHHSMVCFCLSKTICHCNSKVVIWLCCWYIVCYSNSSLWQSGHPSWGNYKQNYRQKDLPNMVGQLGDFFFCSLFLGPESTKFGQKRAELAW